MENLLNKNIRELLPHREPFLFIDKILSVESGRVSASKHISKDEEFLKGHFPGLPLMPGVLIVEAMAQTGGIACVSYCEGGKGFLSKNPSLFFLSRISDIKFKHPVLPGDTLIIKVEVIERFEPFFKVQALCEVNGKMVAEGELVLTRQDREEK